jgi:receptor protein-tyrosine kinase
MLATAGSIVEADVLREAQQIVFKPASQAHLVNKEHPEMAPGEEFRSLRTRLNHLQSLQPIHTIVVTSPSPAEGKSFTAANLALAQSHLAGNPTLLADFDFRRPTIHRLFQIDRAPGLTDLLLGKVAFQDLVRHVEGTNLYFIPAGTPVKNPLELLNLPEVKTLLEQWPSIFNWVIMDTPPLLLSADANLLATLADGTILVTRLGATTIDTITRAMQSLCENNVLGVVANGARLGELYSKYSYYYSSREKDEAADDEKDVESEAVQTKGGEAEER